jgi:hypothetical protein
MAFAGYGGNVVLSSGPGVATSSGSLLLETANAGAAGVSGSITLSSGTTSLGDSGHLLITSGSANSGRAGILDVPLEPKLQFFFAQILYRIVVDVLVAVAFCVL